MDLAVMKEWRYHPGTIEFLQELSKIKQDVLTSWQEGAFTGNSEYETIQKNSRALGKIQAILDIEDYVQQIEEAKND